MSLVQKLRPNVVVLDPAQLSLNQDRDIIDFAAQIFATGVQLHLVAYTFDYSASLVNAILAAGFRGSMSKHAPMSELEVGISAVFNGAMFFDEKFTAAFRTNHASVNLETQQPDDQSLSKREKEVLTLVAKGYPTKQIAYELSLSSKTVDTYKSRATQKLGLSDRTQLLSFALKRGWLA